ncbi:MAG: RecQ family ATP-dependent DNA helicase [Anaerolineae bacterium]
MAPSANSPLGRQISQYLQDNPDGLTLDEIYQRLVRDVEYSGTKTFLLDLLTGNPEVYARGPGGRWLDAALVASGVVQIGPEEEPSKAPIAPIKSEPGEVAHYPQRPGRLGDRYVVFDLETLISDDMDGRLLIEISALKVEDGEPVAKFQTFVNPGREIDPTTEHLTHIGNADVADAPPTEAVLPDFLAFIGDDPLVAHNGRSFDLPVLNHWCCHHGFPEITNNLIDTLDLSVCLFATQPVLTQGQVNKLLGLEPYAAHRAEKDVEALADIFRRLLTRLAAQPTDVRRAVNAFYAPFVLCDEGEIRAEPELPRASSLGPPRHVDPTPYASPEGVRRIFAPGGLMAEQMGPGYEDRPSQVQMAELTWHTFADEHYHLIEAPTGTGKTKAYLYYPAIVWSLITGNKVFISSHTKQLQDQIRGAIEEAQATGFDIRYAVLKGRANYVCKVRLQRVLDETEDPLLRAFLTAWRHQTQEGVLDEFPYTLPHRLLGGVEANSDLKERLCAEREVCDRSDPAHADCYYHASLRQAWDAHLIVINHALLLTADWGTQTRPPIHYLVCDEAHNLEDAATMAVEAEITDRDLSRLASELDLRSGSAPSPLRDFDQGPYRPILENLHRSANQLRFYLRAFGDALEQFVRQQTYERETDERYPVRYRLQWGDVVRDTKRRWAPVKSAYNHLAEHLSGLDDALTDLIDRATVDPATDRQALGEVRALQFRLENAVGLMDDILNVGNYNNVYWVELPPASKENPSFRWALHRAPIKIDWVLRTKVYEQAKAILFTSATLTVDQGFDFFLNRFGLDRSDVREKVQARILPSVFQTEDDILFAIPQNVGRYHPRRAAEFIERASQEIRQLLHLQPHRSLLLFNARVRMEAIYQRIVRPLMDLGLEPHAPREGDSIRGPVQELREKENRVQFGLKGMWEGVDAPGMSYVILEKLPFPLFFEPVVAARMERAKKETGSDFYGYTLPHMVIRFKQGFGRLYRCSGDHGVVVLLDRALRRASYRNVVFNSLPKHRYTPDSEVELYRQIKEFFGGTLTDADLLRQTSAFQQLLEQHTLKQITFTSAEYRQAQGDILAGLEAIFGFPGFIGKQEEVIRAVLSGGDTLGILPTGAGKSLTFQLPAVLRPGLTIVVSPLIALMKDQVDKLRDERRIQCVDYIVSGQSAAEQDEIMQNMIDGNLRLVYVSPERFRDKRLHAALARCEVIQFVIDEAHCVSMWGHDFRPDFLYIYETVEKLGQPPVLALTATATPPVKADIKTQLRMTVSKEREIIDSFDRPNLRFIVYECRTEPEKERWLMRLLYRSNEPAIVYVATRRDADIIADMLRDRGVAARAYHAGMERYDRDVVQEMFMNDQIRVVVATNAFGMGVDKEDIRYVIHYHFPGDIESFYQEAGRAGRSDQIIAYSVVLYHKRDKRIQDYFIKKSIPSPQVLQALFDYFKAQPGEILYLSDDDLAEALPFEEQAIRIGLHILEKEGYIKRGYDFAARCAIKIFEPVRETLARVRDAEQRNRLAQLLEGIAIADYGERKVNLAKLCKRLDLELEETELLLIELNRDEVLSFKAWEKGMTIYRTERLLAADRLELDRPALLAQVQRARRKLHQFIEGYIETKECRRVAILRYFGEVPDHEHCYKCDNCGLPEDIPWSTTFDVDLPDLFTVYHPGYVAIEAAHHFQGRFGRAKVIQTLIGQSYSPWDKRALPRSLTDSEYFKALRGYSYEEMRDFFNLLTQRGYVTTVYKDFNGRRLPMIGVTEKGLAALERGKTRWLPTIGAEPVTDLVGELVILAEDAVYRDGQQDYREFYKQSRKILWQLWDESSQAEEPFRQALSLLRDAYRNTPAKAIDQSRTRALMAAFEILGNRPTVNDVRRMGRQLRAAGFYTVNDI